MQTKETTTETCCNVIHEETVAQVRAAGLEEQEVTDLAAIFAALGDPTRVRILRALSVSEMCVCDIAAALEMTQSAVSHQLRLLRNMRIIKRRKAGRMNYYSLDDDHILSLFETGLHHVSHR
ncbi:winged helix-turn-helix transcriptional regulator [Tumebacillus sp. ITR2]|uniref:Winged helix-turn-helix transcriptional regulator n=1 Tax=Tumebacillus amylolyticus TaxID=2801339 RepID=A0ABS1J8F4_9BACL|nr:metalloregulator ArsR/SmtB family transcription factor [Tumebacillus amylolyticus]MBL0386562.1 winged helix-turn-helix transcriptional regulator [Tumebacillus amylolyticus]